MTKAAFGKEKYHGPFLSISVYLHPLLYLHQMHECEAAIPSYNTLDLPCLPYPHPTRTFLSLTLSIWLQGQVLVGALNRGFKKRATASPRVGVGCEYEVTPIDGVAWHTFDSPIRSHVPLSGIKYSA